MEQFDPQKMKQEIEINSKTYAKLIKIWNVFKEPKHIILNDTEYIMPVSPQIGSNNVLDIIVKTQTVILESKSTSIKMTKGFIRRFHRKFNMTGDILNRLRENIDR